MMTAMMMIKTEDSFSVLHLQYNCPSIRSAPFAAAILQLTCPLPFLHGCPSTARPRSSLRVLLIHMELRPERLYTQYAPFCSSSRFFLPFFFFGGVIQDCFDMASFPMEHTAVPDINPFYPACCFLFCLLIPALSAPFIRPFHDFSSEKPSGFNIWSEWCTA